MNNEEIIKGIPEEDKIPETTTNTENKRKGRPKKQATLNQNKSKEKKSTTNLDENPKLNKLKLEKKRLSGRKSRTKIKTKQALELFNKCASKSLPSYLNDCIETCNIRLDELDNLQQLECYQYFKQNNKYEILITLLTRCKTNEQIDFLKGSLLKSGFFDHLFSNIEWS